MLSVIDLMLRPPRHLGAPEPTEAIVTVAAIVALTLMIMWAWRDDARSGSRLGPFVIAGGALAAIQEPLVDCLGHIWLRTDMPAFTTFARPMPVWAVFAYGTFYGLFAYVFYRIARRGGSRHELRRAVIAVVLYNLVAEPVLVGLDLYVYYGPQPLTVAGLPMHGPFINVTGMVLASLVMVTQPNWFAGRRAALALLLVPACVVGGSLAAGLPVFTALNSGGSPSDPVLRVGAALTIALGTLIMECAIRAQTAPAAGAVPAATRPVREPATTTGRA